MCNGETVQLGREVGWGQLGETVAMTLIRLVGGGGGRGEIEKQQWEAGVEFHSDQCSSCLQDHMLSEYHRPTCIFSSSPVITTASINLIGSISFTYCYSSSPAFFPLPLHFLQTIYHSSLSPSVLSPFASLPSLFSPP